MNEKLFEAAMKMLVARIPDSNLKQLAEVVGEAVELKTRFDRLELRLAGIELAIQTLVKLSVTPEMMRSLEHDSERVDNRI